MTTLLERLKGKPVQSMGPFEELMDELRRKESSNTFCATANENVELAIRNMLQIAGENKEPVKIVSTSLQELHRIYDPSIIHANNAMARGSSIEILLFGKDKDIFSSGFARTVYNHGFDVIRLNGEDTFIPFIVVGSKRYWMDNGRFEGKVEGTGSFNSESVAKTLLGMYGTLKQKLS